MVTGVALGGSVLSSVTVTASPAHDQQTAADRLPGGAVNVARASYDDDGPSGHAASGFDGSDDPDASGYGGSDHGRGGSDDADGGYSADTALGDRSPPTDSRAAQVSNTLTPRATDAASRRPARTGGRHSAARATGRTAHTRPMSSGEEQYRNGCRQGYIVEDCGQYDVPHLLQRGINPYL